MWNANKLVETGDGSFETVGTLTSELLEAFLAHLSWVLGSSDVSRGMQKEELDPTLRYMPLTRPDTWRVDSIVGDDEAEFSGELMDALVNSLILLRVMGTLHPSIWGDLPSSESLVRRWRVMQDPNRTASQVDLLRWRGEGPTPT